MRRSLTALSLLVVLLVLLVPLAANAQGPCPDDPELSQNCDPEAPPYYVVINRDVEYLDRPGTGCQPIILNHPECEDCTSAECTAIDVEAEVCQTLLVGKVPAGETQTLYEMCCAYASNPEGEWMFRIRLLDSDGNCPIDPENPDWVTDLPPGTGIDLPAPIVIGGLAVLGIVLLAAAVGLRRRSAQVV